MPHTMSIKWQQLVSVKLSHDSQKVLGLLIDHNDSLELVLLLLPERLKLSLPIQESHVCCCHYTITVTHNSLRTLLKHVVLPSTAVLMACQ